MLALPMETALAVMRFSVAEGTWKVSVPVSPSSKDGTVGSKTTVPVPALSSPAMETAEAVILICLPKRLVSRDRSAASVKVPPLLSVSALIVKVASLLKSIVQPRLMPLAAARTRLPVGRIASETAAEAEKPMDPALVSVRAPSIVSVPTKAIWMLPLVVVVISLARVTALLPVMVTSPAAVVSAPVMPISPALTKFVAADDEMVPTARVRRPPDVNVLVAPSDNSPTAVMDRSLATAVVVTSLLSVMP